MKKSISLFGALCIIAIHPCVYAQSLQEPDMAFLNSSDAYFGLARPGDSPEIFAPGIVSTSLHEHSAPAFSKNGREIYWTSVVGSKQFIYFSRYEAGKWSAPQTVPFSSGGIDSGPCFSPTADRLYFYSNRPVPSRTTGGSTFDIWYVERAGTAWGDARTLGFSAGNGGLGFVMPSIAANGNMYLTYALAESVMELFVAEQDAEGFKKPVRIPAPINTENLKMNWTCCIAPDESFLIFASQRADSRGYNDLYISFRGADATWGTPKNLGPLVNNGAQVRFPAFSPDGRYFFFVRAGRMGQDDVYWMDASFIRKMR